MATGVPVSRGIVASGSEGNDEGSAEDVMLLVTARNAKSYFPVPLGNVCVRISAFALSHGGEI